MRRQRLVSTKSFLKDKVIRNGFFLSGLFFLVSLTTLLLTYHKIPPVVPLFYSLVRGEQQLASKSFLSMLPATSFFFFTAHIWLSKINYSMDRLFARLLSLTSTIISFLFLVALLHIVIIVI